MPQQSLFDGARPGPHRIEKETASFKLACNYCRSKKIRCDNAVGGCHKCKRLNIPCLWPTDDQRRSPSSKRYIQELCQKIAQLESALGAAQATQGKLATSSTLPLLPGPIQEQTSVDRSMSMPELVRANSPSAGKAPSNIISRLCGRQWKLNSDEEGHYRYFGPTSSLHLSASVSSSLLGFTGIDSTGPDIWRCDDLDPETDAHLLDLYWKYQHTVLQAFDREAFLLDRQAKKTQYFSKALLYCIFACAARASDRPSVRALSLRTEEDVDDELPYLFRVAAKLVEQEMKRPQITTIHALLLLSVGYCGLGKDTDGWILTGHACRLAIDFGLHRVGDQLGPTTLSAIDARVRKTTFWGCVGYDRLWAFYLGRPYCLKLQELAVPAPCLAEIGSTFETRMCHAWAVLITIIGYICDEINDESGSMDSSATREKELDGWHEQLEISLPLEKGGHPSLTVIRMQFCSTLILLHRPFANFGGNPSSHDARSTRSRSICVENGLRMAQLLQEYCCHHGGASTLSGVALHAIATAATALIASVAEQSPHTNKGSQLMALKTCVRSLGELEKTFPVAQRVRRTLQLVIRLCHLERDYLAAQQPEVTASSMILGNQDAIHHDIQAPGLEANEAQSLDSFLTNSPFSWDEFLPAVSQYDVLPSVFTNTNALFGNHV